jgi:hypothetical protein
MFIAYGPAPGTLHPSGGDMFIAVALGKQFFTSEVDEFKMFLSQINRPNMSPRWGEESFARSPSYKHITPPE